MAVVSCTLTIITQLFRSSYAGAKRDDVVIGNVYQVAVSCDCATIFCAYIIILLQLVQQLDIFPFNAAPVLSLALTSVTSSQSFPSCSDYYPKTRLIIAERSFSLGQPWAFSKYVIIDSQSARCFAIDINLIYAKDSAFYSVCAACTLRYILYLQVFYSNLPIYGNKLFKGRVILVLADSY